MKKALSLVLVLALALTMGVTAFAAFGTITLEVKGVDVSASLPAPVTGLAGIETSTTPLELPNGVPAGSAATNYSSSSGTSTLSLSYFPSDTEFTANGEFTTAAGATAITDAATTAIPVGSILVLRVNDTDDGMNFYAWTISEAAPGGTGGGGGTPVTVVGSSETAFVPELDRIKVALPTATNLEFKLDPQGLSAILDGHKANTATLEGGKIAHFGEGRIINESNFEVKVDVSFQASNKSAGSVDSTAAQFLDFTTSDADTKTAVNADDKNNIVLYAVPSATDLVDTDVDNDATADKDEGQYGKPFAASTKGYVITKANPTVLSFVLDKAEYDITNTDDEFTAALTGGSTSATSFKFGGLVNVNANWSKFVDLEDDGDPDNGIAAIPASEFASVDVIFTPARATEAEKTDAETVENETYGLIKTDVNGAAAKTMTPELVGAGEAIGFTAPGSTSKEMTVQLVDNSFLVIPFNFGDNTVKTIAAGSGAPWVLNTDYRTDTPNVINITGARVTTIRSFARDVVVTITLSDDSTYTLNLEYVA